MNNIYVYNAVISTKGSNNQPSNRNYTSCKLKKCRYDIFPWIRLGDNFMMVSDLTCSNYFVWCIWRGYDQIKLIYELFKIYSIKIQI